MAKKRLSNELEELAFDMVLDGFKLDDIAKKLGLTGRKGLQRYQIYFPEFQELFQRARLAECDYLEERVRYVLDDYSVDAAKIQLEVLTRLLKWRDPKRYGDRQQIDMNVSIDVLGSLERANQRVVEAMKTNVIEMVPTKKLIED